MATADIYESILQRIGRGPTRVVFGYEEPEEVNNESLAGLLRNEDGEQIRPIARTERTPYQTMDRYNYGIDWDTPIYALPRMTEAQFYNTETHTVTHRQFRNDIGIENVIMEEVVQYEATMGRRPSYLSLNTEAFEALFTWTRHRGDRMMNRDVFMGVNVVYNPTQEQVVLALGTPEQELGRSLYGRNQR